MQGTAEFHDQIAGFCRKLPKTGKLRLASY
jgi:hypothetical protein